MVAITRIFRLHRGQRSTSNPKVRFISTGHSRRLDQANSAPSSNRPQWATEIMVGSTVRAHVAQLVNEVFLKRGRVEDMNLSAVERLFAKDRLGPRSQAMLAMYRRLLDDEKLLAVSDDPVQAPLRLAGITAERDDGATVWVCIRNTIVASAFDHAWVEERLAAQ